MEEEKLAIVCQIELAVQKIQTDKNKSAIDILTALNRAIRLNSIVK
jgi:hypothetical protein